MSTVTSNAAVLAAAEKQRRATFAAFIGTAMEWYDFFIFGTAAALAFNKVFFPTMNPDAGRLISFAILWVGFLTRPLGGAICGHLGDKYGRKNVLIGTLVLMGLASTFIGLVPNYAQIGIAAPVILVVLRALQGFAVGGEWAGAVVMATEHADDHKKNRAGAWVQQGNPVGAILSALAFVLVGRLADDDFVNWGWRIPFLVSFLLVIIGLVIRMKVEESDEFREMKDMGEAAGSPISEVFAKAPAVLAFAVMASISGISVAYFLNTFMLSWTTNSLGINRQSMLDILLITYVVQFLWQPVAAHAADKIGNAKVMIAGLAFAAVIAIPYFLAVMSADLVVIGIAQSLMMVGVCTYYAMLASFLAAAFPVRYRYTGVSLAYQLCSTLIGGSTPLIAQAILAGTGGSQWGIAAFYIVNLAATGVGVFLLARIVHRNQKR
ncbi:MFS transporter [Rhizobium sp. BR 249]|uniref:MFS transporter n=1 Tax=Rhizobium sp. BR 249 TaxID=3040011 RepID=UPI0039BF986D